jgi:uncharacterized membrane protein
MVKTASFGVLHLTIAFSISYALTGDVAISGAITLLEPLANTVAFYFFDRYWGHPVWQSRLSRVKTHFGLKTSREVIQVPAAAN